MEERRKRTVSHDQGRKGNLEGRKTSGRVSQPSQDMKTLTLTRGKLE